MAKHQYYDYKQSVLEPIFLEDQLLPGTLEHAIHYVVEERLDFSVEEFKMDDETGNLICPAGEELYFRNFMTNDPQGYKYIAYQAMKTSCSGCKLQSKCLRNPKTESRQVHILYEKPEGTITDKMKEKIDTPEGRKIYSKRLGIVEPVFGNIRACKKMDRFTLRGRVKVGFNGNFIALCII